MIEILRTGSDNQDFIKLVNCLDEDIVERDGEDSNFFAQYNKIDKIKFVVIAYKDGHAVGCGAIKEYNNKMEIKRMYVLPNNRGMGIASKILKELENWAYELSFKICILQTGKKHIEAITFYKKNGFKLIPNFGQYANMANSICFEKNGM